MDQKYVEGVWWEIALVPDKEAHGMWLRGSVGRYCLDHGSRGLEYIGLAERGPCYPSLLRSCPSMVRARNATCARPDQLSQPPKSCSGDSDRQ
jgi:hypothetical protein